MTSRELEQQRLVSQMADMLKDRGLGAIALIGLEVGRPLAFLFGQLMWLVQPVMGLVMPGERLAQLAYILEDSEAVNQLIAHLEEEEKTKVGMS